MKKKKLIPLLAIPFLLVGAPFVSAYTHPLLNPWGTDFNNTSTNYRIQTDFGSTSKSQMVSAMGVWNANIKQNFLSKSMSETTDTSPSPNFVNTITKNYYGADGIVAKHIPYSNQIFNTVYESDIRFNISYTFSNSQASGAYDIQSIATHEFGHALRVNHSTVFADTMYDTASTNDIRWRTPTLDDIAAVQASTKRWLS